MGKFDRYWEMTSGGPYDKGEEMFKCTDCGAETFPDEGFNGEPSPGNCAKECRSRGEDWKPGNVSRRFKANLARMFPNSPGADI